jgi:glucosamine--fructose-6-phosphate aminotransferase (isomerizing)
MTGEGSSRIFPAKSFISQMLGPGGAPISLATEGARQAAECDLSPWTVMGASNSGQTKEIVTLFQKLRAENHSNLFGMTANAGTKLTELADCTVLTCGKEEAVAATMSVVEQALVYHSIFVALTDCQCGCVANKGKAAELAEQTLAPEIDPKLIEKIAAAPTLYLVGRNNGVAEELALKTNEITRQKSRFLEGTIIVHGIEEIMQPNEVAIVIDPFEEDTPFIKKNLVDGVGMTVIAISSKPTIFPTIEIPSMKRYDPYFQLLAGWNLLVQTGIALGVNIDKPKRARKIGNEF